MYGPAVHWKPALACSAGFFYKEEMALRMSKEQALDWGMAALFIISIVLMQLIAELSLAFGLWGFLALSLVAVPSRYKPAAAMILAIVTGYYAAGSISEAMKEYSRTVSPSAELAVALSRIGLVGYLVPLALTVRLYPLRTNLLAVGTLPRLPIASRDVPQPIWRALSIALLANIALFCLLIDWRYLFVQPAVWFWSGLLFASINSSLETVLWRGFALSRCIDAFGAIRGILICGAAFGLYHYSFIQDWRICILFGFGGIFFGWLAWKSGGLFAPWLLHFVMNILFVMSGMIFGY